MSADSLLLYALSFAAVWFGAGLILGAINNFSHKLHISSFFLSFFLLGLLTSIPEFAVGLVSVSQKNPEIFVGNLIGGIPVLFLLIIPLFAIFARGVKLAHQLSPRFFISSLIIIGLPSLFAADHRLTLSEGVIILGGYLFLFLQAQLGGQLFSQKISKKTQQNRYSLSDMLKLLAGVAIVFIASRVIVQNTVTLATVLGVSPFLISLILVSIGTNLPELSITMRAAFSREKDIALGDYLGSAVASSLLISVFTLLNQNEVTITNNIFTTVIVVVVGVSLFYYFARSGKELTRKEALVLLVLYLLFIISESLVSKLPLPSH